MSFDEFVQRACEAEFLRVARHNQTIPGDFVRWRGTLWMLTPERRWVKWNRVD